MLLRKMEAPSLFGSSPMRSVKEALKGIWLTKRADGIPVVTNRQGKLPARSIYSGFDRLRNLSFVEIALLALSLLTLVALVGVAYAVSVKGNNKPSNGMQLVSNVETKPVSIETAAITENTAKLTVAPAILNDNTRTAISQPVVAVDELNELSEESVMIADDNVLAMLDTVESQRTTVEAAPVVIEEKTFRVVAVPSTPSAAKVPKLTKAQKKRIKQLKAQLSIVENKLSAVDLESMQLEESMEQLVNDNRALSDKLRLIDSETNRIQAQLN